MVRIRPATTDDLAVINGIYNQSVRASVFAFDLVEKTVDERHQWFSQHNEQYPIIVAQDDEAVLGWASLSPWSSHGAYFCTVELSVFVDETHQGLGVGKMLLREIVARAEALDYHTVIARITGGNEASLHMHRALGFEHIGVMKEVGRKFGQWLDVHLMQKIFANESMPGQGTTNS